jgi:hypothetical protein
MNPDANKGRRFEPPQPRPPREDLLDEIDALAPELTAAAEATGSGGVPIAARADYLRAQAAYRGAVIAWATAREADQFSAVRDALEQCRSALESTRERLRR